MLDEFRQFLLRGNVVEMGVGVVMGVAFKRVVDGLVADMITPLIAAVAGEADFSALTFSLNGSQFMYGRASDQRRALVRDHRRRRLLPHRQADEPLDLALP